MSNQIVLTLYVPSIEETAAWYERILGWTGHFDTFDEAGRCLFGTESISSSRGRSKISAWKKSASAISGF